VAGHPAVAEVAVAEVPVREDGVTSVAAFVVPREGEAPDADAVLAFAAERLAAYKRPKAVYFVPELPRSANGKVIRRALRDAGRA
jgi:acyl-coenzyme A synthetase/AMP-(fatty) acid ligase